MLADPPLSSAPKESRCHNDGREDQEYPEDYVAPPLGAAAVGVDVDVGHAYSARAGTERDAAGATRRFRRSSAYRPANGIRRLPTRAQRAKMKSGSATVNLRDGETFDATALGFGNGDSS